MNEEDAYTDMDKVVDLLGTLKLNCYIEDLEDCRSYINLIVDLKEEVAGNNPGFTMSSNNGLRVHGDLDQCDREDTLYSIEYDVLMKVLPKALDYFLTDQKKKDDLIKELMVNTKPRYLDSDDIYMPPAKLIDITSRESMTKLIMDKHSHISDVHGVAIPLYILDLIILDTGRVHVTMATNGRNHLDRTCDLGKIRAYTPVADILPYISH